ncbi:MAG: DHH family phosphoesterase [Solirubrobacterales bacterium]
MKSERVALQQALAANPSWTVIGHNIPDGDCTGSVLAVFQGLKALGKQVTAVVEDGLPEMYHFLDGADQIGSLADMPGVAECIIYVDCADRNRVGEKLQRILPEPRLIVNIDHHVSNDFFGQVNLVDAEASSTCELVYRIFSDLGIAIDSRIAGPLYCGIVADTGGFQYLSTSPETHRVTAELLKKIDDLAHLRNRIYESKSRTELEVLRASLGSLRFSEDGRIAWMELSYDTLNQLGAVNKNYEGIINHARSVDSVEVAIMFREFEPGRVKIGFRSKGILDVNQLAAGFGGGGHPRAAGAQINGQLDHVRSQVIAAVKEAL